VRHAELVVSKSSQLLVGFKTLTAFEMLRRWIAKARKSKLSTRVIVLFVAALFLPWCGYA
jgi:hypothetical protein